MVYKLFISIGKLMQSFMLLTSKCSRWMSGDGGHDLRSSKILATALGITVANMV